MTTIEELISEKEELERLVVKLAAENQQLKDEISEKKANDILFADLIEQWLKSRKMAVKINTYEAYRAILSQQRHNAFRDHARCA